MWYVVLQSLSIIRCIFCIPSGVYRNRRPLLFLAALFTICFAVLRLSMELCQLLNLPQLLRYLSPCFRFSKNGGDIKTNFIEWKYFTLFSNYVEVPMYILSIVFVCVFHHECWCPSRWQWQTGTVALFLAWIALLLFLNKWPALGIYIGMLWKIILRFLTVTIILALLLIAFTFAFYMAFYEPSLPVRECY